MKLSNDNKSLGILVVGPTGIEPATSAMSRQRSNQLSYGPKEECEIYTSEAAGASPIALDNISDNNYCHIQFYPPIHPTRKTNGHQSKPPIV